MRVDGESFTSTLPDDRMRASIGELDRHTQQAYTPFPVSSRQPIVAATLAIAVAWAGAVCACELSAVDEADPTGHHAHHGMADSPPTACAHLDCHGDCGVEATPPKGHTASIELPKPSLDDLAFAAAARPVAVAARVPSYHHPPWHSFHPVDSPVSRFDRLLN